MVLITIYSCEKTVQEPNVDTIPPQATIIYPSDGEHVSGEVIIQIRSVDNQETDYVEFYINQEKIHTDSTSNDNDIYTCRWNTMALMDSEDSLSYKYAEDEYHYIYIIAYDASGNSFATTSIKSRIDNIDNEAPNAFILTPFQGQSVEGNIDITVIASDNDSISIVKFYIS